MNIIVALTYIVLVAALVTGAYGVIFSSLYGSNHSLTPNTPKGLRTDKEGLLSYNIQAAKISIAAPLNADNQITLDSYIPETYLNLFKWKTDSNALASLTVFMENIARSYNFNDTEEQRKKKIKLMSTFVNRLENEIYLKSAYPKPLDVVPWGESMVPFSVLIPRFLASYLLLTNNDLDSGDLAKAVALLKYLVTGYNVSLQKAYSGFMAVILAVPYLVGVLIGNPDKIETETKQENIQLAYDFMNPKVKATSKLEDNRWYEDLSYSLSKLEFSYTPLVLLGDFYSSIWVSLGIPFTGKQLFANALGKLLHPTIDIVPQYAFYGLCGIKHNYRYYNTQPNTGIFVYPEFGVGVYKTDKFYFHLRVQKPNQTIAIPRVLASYYDYKVSLFSRKIYFQKDNTDTALGCVEDIFHPNLIEKSNETIPRGSKFNSDNDKIITVEDTTHSFIGIIENYLVWMNEFKYGTIADVSFYEAGIFCPQGCFQYYRLDNYANEDANNYLSIVTTEGSTSANKSKGSFEMRTLDSGSASALIVQRIQNNFNPEFSHIVDKYQFSFKTPNSQYKVVYNKDLRIAVITSETDKKTYLLSQSPKLDDTINYENATYIRDPLTMTYSRA